MHVCTVPGTIEVDAPGASSNQKFSPSANFFLLLMQMVPFQLKVCPDGAIQQGQIYLT